MRPLVAATHRKGARTRAKLREFVDAYVDNDLLTYASAISFQVLSSLVPLMLFAVGLLGFFSLEGVWRDELGPDIKPHVSGPAFSLMDEVVNNVLDSRTVFWVTAGFVIALWEISGAMRAVMGAVNRVYGDETRRSWRRRMGVSTVLGLAVGACLLVAPAIILLGPLVYGDVDPGMAAILFVFRWGVAAAVVLLAVAILLHFAPERHQPLHWVTFGALLIMAGWLVMSAGFALYLRDVADYNSIFGGLATVVVLIAYLYAGAVVFLGGIQVDAIVRK
jgi:membrane protein